MEECDEMQRCFERFAVIETKLDNNIKQGDRIIKMLDVISPSVKENSWWIEKIKWGFVMITVIGVGLGIVSLIWN